MNILAMAHVELFDPGAIASCLTDEPSFSITPCNFRNCNKAKSSGFGSRSLSGPGWVMDQVVADPVLCELGELNVVVSAPETEYR